MFIYKYPPKGINVNQFAIKLKFLLKISTNRHSNYLLVLRFHSYSVSRPSYIHIYACPTEYVGAHVEFVRAHQCINDGVGMVLRPMYRLVQKKCPLLEFLSTLLPTNPGQPVHSLLAPREPPSPNLNPFIILRSSFMDWALILLESAGSIPWLNIQLFVICEAPWQAERKETSFYITQPLFCFWLSTVRSGWGLQVSLFIFSVTL